MRELTQAEVRERLLQILLYFNKYCEMHKYRYYISAGTLLGAIRHKGFEQPIEVEFEGKEFPTFSCWIYIKINGETVNGWV